MSSQDVVDLTDETDTPQGGASRLRILESAFIDLSIEHGIAPPKKRKASFMDLTADTDKENALEDQAGAQHPPANNQPLTKVRCDDHPESLAVEDASSTSDTVGQNQQNQSETVNTIDGFQEAATKRQKVDEQIIQSIDNDSLDIQVGLLEDDEYIDSQELETRQFKDYTALLTPGLEVEDTAYISSDDETILSCSKEASPTSLVGLEESKVIIDLLREDDIGVPFTEVHKDPDVVEPIKFSRANARFTCAVGKTIEFSNGTFMKIEKMIYDVQKQVILIGKLLIRQNSFNAKVPKRRNEVLWIIDGVDTCNITPTRRIYRATDIVRNRRLIMTNRTFPRSIDDSNHPRNHPDSCPNPTQDVVDGPLFCRMKHFCLTKRGGRDLEEIWEALAEDEADDDARVPARKNRHRWRGPTTIGGSSVSFNTVSDLESGHLSELLIQTYTFGDSFCGAGGTSCGARSAGLRPVWSFDANAESLQTYQLNFPDTTCHRMLVHDFVEHARKNDVLVDVLHLSPPCQPFSPAHTVANAERDEPNQAALLSVGALLEVVKPRIATLEQTLGLESRHSEWFEALINDFVRAGYSFHWKVMKCSDYGVPQTRKRLIFFAAGPGEQLPDFPQPTHGIGPGLKPIDTVRKVLLQVPRNAPDHNTDILLRAPKAPYNPDVMARTVTCNGGVGNYHPSGLRKFTVREFAAFQTFPASFKLARLGLVHQRRQVGNAVPPRMAQAFYEAIIKSLKKSDEVN